MRLDVQKHFENENINSRMKICEKELPQSKSEESEIAVRPAGQEENLVEDNSRLCA